MTLKLMIDSLEAVEAPFRDLYEAKDGKFALKVDGLEDTSGLKTALEKERQQRSAAEREAKAFKALGKSPDELNELFSQSQRAAEEAMAKAGEFDKLKAAIQERHAAELKARDERLIAKDKALEKFLIDSEATKAIAAAKGIPDLLLPHVKSQVRVVESNGEYSVQVVNAQGDPRVNSKGDVMTISDLVSEMRSHASFGRAFEASGQSGSGMQPGNSTGGAGQKTITRAAFDAMAPAEQAAAVRSGVIPIDPP